MQLDGSLAWPRPIAKVISLEKFCCWYSILENHKTLPPRMICNIWYLPVRIISNFGSASWLLLFYISIYRMFYSCSSAYDKDE